MPMSPRLLRPRASGGFDPRSISGLAGWWDAADSSTLFDATTGGSSVAPDGGVGRWEDKSGNGRHATQGIAGSRPLRKTSQFNGRDALLFDGSDDVLYVDDFYVNQHTFFAVYRSANNANRHTVARKGFQTNVTLEWLMRSTDATTVTHFASAATNASAAATAVAGSLRLATGRYDKTQVTCSVNGGAESATAFTSDILDTGLRIRIGAGFADNLDAGALAEQLSGEICELLLYNRALSASEVSTVNRYMAGKWGIALA
jgi:hypothetical protein